MIEKMSCHDSILQLWEQPNFQGKTWCYNSPISLPQMNKIGSFKITDSNFILTLYERQNYQGRKMTSLGKCDINNVPDSFQGSLQFRHLKNLTSSTSSNQHYSITNPCMVILLVLFIGIIISWIMLT